MGWQEKKVQLPDSRIADGVVTINPTTGEPYTPATGGAPVSIVGTSGVEAGTNAIGQLRVRAESTSLFTEEFDSLDLTNRWTQRSSGGSASAAQGTLVLSGSATANAWGGIQSQPTFQAIGLNFLEFGGVFMFPNIAIANTKRFFGMGTIPSTPTLTTPITDGFGFELDGNGLLWAVIYESGVRSPRSVNITTAAGLTSGVPLPFILGRRADTLLFYATNNQKPDAVIPLPGLDVTALPLAFLAVNGSPAPSSAPSFVCFGVGIGDTGCNAGSIKDPVNPFWQANVIKPNTPVAASNMPLAVGLHPSSPLPANTTTKLRDAFETYTPGQIWTEVKGTGDLVYVDGNAAAASYMVISKDPLTAGTETYIESKATFGLPVEVIAGLSMSQRTLGQEFSVEIVDTQAPLVDIPDIAISSISQTTTTLTVDTVTPHGFSVGKSIGIRDCSDFRANYPAIVVASVPSPTQFTATAGPGGALPSLTITNPAGAKGFVFFRERLGRAQNGISQIFENASATGASLYIRSEAGDALPSATIGGSHILSVGTTAPVQLVNSAYQYAFSPTTEYRYTIQPDRAQWSDYAVDGLAASSSRLLRTQVCPDPSIPYKLRIRANNAKSLSVPVAQIVTAVKTGTTTATITTDRPHGLLAGDPVTVYGIRDQAAASFPNLTTATAVASVVDATNFTIVIGTASTVTSYGGYVAKVNGGNLPSTLGALTMAAQSATLSTLVDGTRQLVVVGSATWAGPVIGDLVNLVGVRDNTTGATLGVDGAWKIANIATTNLTLVLPFAGSMTLPADFASTNCGGGVIKRTDLRISYVRAFEYTRGRVEVLARPAGDISGALPVAIQGGTLPTVTGITTITTAGTPAAPATAYFVNSAASTNGALILTGTSGLQAFFANNIGASDAWVKLYNKATAPTVGTDVPEMVIRVPANGQVELTPGFNGYRFPLGLGIAITGAAADTDTTAVAAGQVKVKISRTA